MRKVFVKQTYYNAKLILGAVYALCVFVTSVYCIRFEQFIPSGLVFLVVIGVSLYYFAEYLNGIGLYIEGDEIYFKRRKKIKVDCTKIIGIKIIKSQSQGKWGTRDIKSINGKPLFSAVYVINLNEKMRQYKNGDVQFLHDFREYILFYTIYDIRAIEIMKKLNPDIEII